MCHLKTNENVTDPNLIVGLNTADDAGVYKISEDYALIQTLDFFTPIVDDPYMFGQIAATNSLSDVYAMGGTPLTAMNIACFSTCLDPSVLADILRGGADKIIEAGATLVGGHTVTDKEVKYGLSVTGFIHPDKVTANLGAQSGDVLILTKPIGTGIITTALKFEHIKEEDIDEAVISMSTLNKGASIAMQKVGIHACTDVTGFGLLGHICEMIDGSQIDIELKASDIPIMKNVIDLISKGAVPGGARSNKQYFETKVKFNDDITEEYKIALFDPQTSGGLLISVPEDKSLLLIEELNKEKALCTNIIGKVVEKNNKEAQIRVY